MHNAGWRSHAESVWRMARPVLVASDLLRIHEPIRPLLTATIILRKRVVVAARSLCKGLPAEFVSIIFGNLVIIALRHDDFHPDIKRASRQAITKAALDASTGILCETAAKHLSLAWAYEVPLSQGHRRDRKRIASSGPWIRQPSRLLVARQTGAVQSILNSTSITSCIRPSMSWMLPSCVRTICTAVCSRGRARLE